MRKWLAFLTTLCFTVLSPTRSVLVVTEEAHNKIDISPLGPMRAWHLKINPTMP